MLSVAFSDSSCDEFFLATSLDDGEENLSFVLSLIEDLLEFVEEILVLRKLEVFLQRSVILDQRHEIIFGNVCYLCLLYTSPSPRDKRQSRMPSSA